MPPEEPTRHTFPKTARLLRSGEFDSVFACRLSAGDGRLVVYARPNDLGRPRLGLVVSRKVGKAVRRNRWKRVLREAFRLAQHELPAMDYVCLPRGRDDPSLRGVSQSLKGIAARLEKKARRRQDAPTEDRRP